MDHFLIIIKEESTSMFVFVEHFLMHWIGTLKCLQIPPGLSVKL